MYIFILPNSLHIFDAFGTCDCRISVDDQVSKEIGENGTKSKEDGSNWYKQGVPRLVKDKIEVSRR